MQRNLQITDKLGPLKLSSIERVSFIQRSFNTQSTMVGHQQVSFIERCPLFGGSTLLPSF